MCRFFLKNKFCVQKAIHRTKNELIVYDCQIAIFMNFAIAFNVKALQLRDAITRKLYRKPIKIFFTIDVTFFWQYVLKI